jgi:deoxyribodipyrimidine photolyase-related protein
MRNLIVILGDQLDRHSSVLDDFDDQQDAIWMAEVPVESTHVWSHKARIAVFLSGMRHFAAELRKQGKKVYYDDLGTHPFASLDAALGASIAQFRPERVLLVRPGDYRVRESLRQVCSETNVDYCERSDTHFIISTKEFTEWARGRKEFRLEHFYRVVRRRTKVLMDGDQPTGGEWNFDAENRGSFDLKRGPGMIPQVMAFEPDAITQAVFAVIEDQFPNHPGRLEHFDWPLTPVQGEQALNDFIQHRLCAFGQYQDAMWTDEPFLFHSRLSVALNLKLITPLRVAQAAEAAYRQGLAPIAAVEGFIRQVIGWREYVRGLYWLRMPKYASENALNAQHALPQFYWDANTDMQCLRQALQQTLDYGYAHHIQRLMVTGLFALMFGVKPEAIHQWYLAVYVDAVEWVELPNVMGMSQYADGGVMASKPYCASGKYIDRMSNYCKSCRYKPDIAVGADACPFTTLYWDFLATHKARFSKHPRAGLQWRSLEKIAPEKLKHIEQQAASLRSSFCHPEV